LFNNGVLYGAIQSGEHQFYTREKNKNDILQGQAKFTTVWTFKNNIWKINEILSYDHGEPRPEANIFDNDSIIEKWLGQNNIKTLGLGIIEKGKLKQIKVYGEISKGNSAPYNTIFNVASLTKPITAIVALKLVSMGKWN
jgi:CubicO group peptidase (beta-lactamase class C family)